MNQNDKTFLGTDAYLKSLWAYERLFSLSQGFLQLDKQVNEEIAEEVMYNVFKALNIRWLKVLRPEKVGNFIKGFRHLENILASQYALRGKFYRDHFTHMVRVMLLSYAIGNVLGLKDQELDACVLAGLFHDIGLPLFEARNTFDGIRNALSKCYDYLHNVQVNWPEPDKKRIKKAEFWKEITKTVNEPEKKLSKHGLLGAFEFLGFFDLKKSTEPEDIKKILLLTARAIANHDCEVGTATTYSQEPVSTILILADEIQDWQRPVGGSDQIVVDAIKSFEIAKEKISATIDYSKCPFCDAPRFFRTDLEESAFKEEYFSPLLQIRAKQKNLERITLNGGFPELRLKYELPFSDYTVLGNPQILAILRGTRKWVSWLNSLQNAFASITEDTVLDSSMDSKLDYYFELDVLRRIRDFTCFLDGVTPKPHAPSFNLFQNIKTREFVITTEEKMPAEIVAYKDNQGKLQWNYKLSALRPENRIVFEITLRPSVYDRETYYLTKEGRKTISKLERIIRKKVCTSKGYAERFVTFLQFLFFSQ